MRGRPSRASRARWLRSSFPRRARRSGPTGRGGRLRPRPRARPGRTPPKPGRGAPAPRPRSCPIPLPFRYPRDRPSSPASTVVTPRESLASVASSPPRKQNTDRGGQNAATCRGSRGSEETAQQPGDREHEQGPAPVIGSAQPGQEGERQHRGHVLGTRDEVHHPVVNRPHAARVQVRLGKCGTCHHRKNGDRVKRQPGSVDVLHVSAFHRKKTPPTATTAPLARSSPLPHIHRRASPTPMPIACRQPVAATKPML